MFFHEITASYNLQIYALDYVMKYIIYVKLIGDCFLFSEPVYQLAHVKNDFIETVGY